LNFADDVVRVGPLNMKLNSQDLKKIAELTLDCYNQNAEDFWEGTRNHDVSQNIAALLQHIESERPFTILDFGCGPGRDLKVFAELGHIAIGLEGAAHFAAMARAYSGCEVWQQDFLKLDLPENYFDGVFANASLFHVPSQELPRVLLELRACLRPRSRSGETFSRVRYGCEEPSFTAAQPRQARHSRIARCANDNLAKVAKVANGPLTLNGSR
jgi:SAM-dependent methyltransferase